MACCETSHRRCDFLVQYGDCYVQYLRFPGTVLCHISSISFHGSTRQASTSAQRSWAPLRGFGGEVGELKQRIFSEGGPPVKLQRLSYGPEARSARSARSPKGHGRKANRAEALFLGPPPSLFPDVSLGSKDSRSACCHSDGAVPSLIDQRLK